MLLTVSLAAYGWHPAAWQLAPAMPPDLKSFSGQAQAAERAGLDAVLLGLPVLAEAARRMPQAARIRFDPLPLLGALIAVTNRIGLAACWPIDMAEPFHVARVFATLDHLSSGRTGWIVDRLPPDLLASGFAYAPQRPETEAPARLDEFVDVVRQLWDSWEDESFVVDQSSGTFADPARVHPILHKGRYFTVRGPLNVPRPVQGNPVIFCTDPGDVAERAALASHAEMVLAACETAEQGRMLRTVWHDTVASTGRDPHTMRLLLSVMPILGASPGQAAERAERLDALAGPVLPTSMATAAERFVGTPAGLAAMMAAWTEAGACDGFNILPSAASDLRLVTEGVVPLLREQGLRSAAPCQPCLRAQLGLQRPRSRFAA